MSYAPSLQAAISQEPTGWNDPTLVTISYDSTGGADTRKVTLSGTGKMYWQGRLVIDLSLGNHVSVAHTATNGGWFYYYDGSAYVWSQTAWTFDMAQIAYVNYVSAAPTTSYGIRECHGMMNWQAHKECHQTIGAYKVSGGDVTGTLASTTAADRRVAISALVMADEDLTTTNPQITSGTARYCQFTVAASSVATFTPSQDDIVPLNTAVPKWNNPTTGAMTDFTANQYGAIFVLALPVTSDATSQTFRYAFVAPQTASNTLSTINAITTADISLGNLGGIATEYTFISKIVIRYAAGNWTLISISAITGTRYQQVTSPAGTLSSVTTDTTLTGNGTVADPLHVVGYADQYYEVVGSTTLTGSIQDFITWDGETYPWMELEMYCASHTANGATYLWANADNTQANYNSQDLNSTSTTASAANNSQSLMTAVSGASAVPFKVVVNMYGKYQSAKRMANVQMGFVSGSTMYLRNRASWWTGTAAITKLSLTGPANDIWYYRLRARKG